MDIGIVHTEFFFSWIVHTYKNRNGGIKAVQNDLIACLVNFIFHTLLSTDKKYINRNKNGRMSKKWEREKEWEKEHTAKTNYRTGGRMNWPQTLFVFCGHGG